MKDVIRNRALALGFDAVGFAPAILAPEAGERLSAFLADGKQGDMGWLTERAEQRRSPTALWPQARSVIVVGVNYGPDHNPLENLKTRNRGNISVYARGRDYHDVLKKKLRVLARAVAENHACEVKLFVDTAPVMEKPLAARAGLGWQGKHTNLVSRTFGSWLFLGEIFTTLDLEPDHNGTDHCGACSACLDICPTKAITAPYQLDARRCISYLTIEHKGHIPREFRAAIGNRIYGCDDCLAVCPWNKFARTGSNPDLIARPGNILPPLADLLCLDDAAFRTRFSSSPVRRTGRDRFVRNVLIAAGNSADVALVPQVTALLDDSSPLIRAAAIWALARLDPDRLAMESARQAGEPDRSVIDEWQTAEREAASAQTAR